MPKTFLEIAELILREAKKPLTPDEIFKIAVASGRLESNGKTPAFSMKARISTEIRKNGFDSKFMRFGPNRFALREFGLKEHISQPFKKSIPKEIITCIDQIKLNPIKNNFGFFTETENILNILSTESNFSFIERKDAEKNIGYKQLISYVLLTNSNQEILTYKRGSYSNAHSMIKGSTCLGFGGHVQDLDTRKLFTKGFGGVFDTAEREVSEELKGIMPQNLEIVGYINDDSSPEGVKHLGIVLKGTIPESFNIKQVGTELSVNGLKFMTASQLWEHFYEFEFWSHLIIRKFYNSYLTINPVVIKPSKFNVLSNVLVFVGEIASGKTIICEILSEKLGFNHISTRKCVAKLIEMDDFGIQDRTEFQKKAEIFINKKEGPFLLAQEIHSDIDIEDKISVIDGIRHLETLRELKKLHLNLIVIYIESTRDDSFRNYCNRSKGKATINQFREVRHHPVEEEIQQIKYEADAYIFNGGDKQQLFEAFINWFNNNKK
jgi:predicted NUDIX family phosphoesterase/dephospho-CoA kinase